MCSSYNVKLTKDLYGDFESELKYYLLVVVSRSNLNNIGQIIKYMDLTVKGYFRKYLKKYKNSSGSVSLNGAKYSSDKGTKKEKSLIDYIPDKSNPFDTFENKQFSSNMINILKKLPKEDLSFIILRFQENYSYEELSNHLNISIEEVKQKELELLSKLRSNDDIKVYKK